MIEQLQISTKSLCTILKTDDDSKSNYCMSTTTSTPPSTVDLRLSYLVYVQRRIRHPRESHPIILEMETVAFHG